MDERTPPRDLSRLKIDRSKPPEPSRWRPRAPFLVCGAAVVIALTVLLTGGSDEKEGSAVAASPSRVESVPPPPPLARPAGSLSASGYVVPQRKAAVASKATGRLAKLYVGEGDVVKAGQIIGALESGDLEAQLREKEANLAALEARIGFAQAELEEAGHERERASSLRRSGATSQNELERSLARHKKAEADLTASKANRDLGAAQLERAKVDLEYTKIVAPFDGTVLTKNADIGEVVAPFGSASNARAAIVTMADMSSLQVEADVSESNLSRVFVGQPCVISLDSFPDRKYKGVVEKIVPTVDRAKATVLTKIRFLDRDEHVIPEMSAKVVFEPGARANEKN